MPEEGENVPQAVGTGSAERPKPVVLTTLEAVRKIASKRSKEDFQNILSDQQVAIEAESELRKLGIIGRPQLQEVYALGYLDLQIAKHRGEYNPIKKLASEAGRNFHVLDSAIDRIDPNPLKWQPDISVTIADQVEGICVDTRNEVLKRRGIEAVVPTDIPEDVKEEIDRLAEEKMEQIRKKAVEDPVGYLKEIRQQNKPS